MSVIYSKIIYGKIEHMKIIFDRLKDKYYRATRRRVLKME
jgi:hypothetical protein